MTLGPGPCGLTSSYFHAERLCSFFPSSSHIPPPMPLSSVSVTEIGTRLLQEASDSLLSQSPGLAQKQVLRAADALGRQARLRGPPACGLGSAATV